MLLTIWLIMLRGGFAVLQAPVFDGQPFDPFSFQQDGWAAPEVDVGRREIAEALVVAVVVVVADKGFDLRFKIARQMSVVR